VSGSLKVSSWEDEIQLNRELLALSGEMWKSDGAMGIEIFDNKDVWGVREKFKEKGARLRIELNDSDGRGVGIEEEKRRTLLEVDSDTEIV